MPLTYNPHIFDTATLEDAKRIAVTPTDGRDTEARWARETPYLADLIAGRLGLREGQLLVDYGCGVGRLAKALIERTGCRVLGVDISEDMRAFAVGYVGSPLFSAASWETFASRVAGGLRADAAIAIWVLQHCPRPAADISQLRAALDPSGRLAVVNSDFRWIPTKEKRWAHDTIDVRALLRERFVETGEAALDPEEVGDNLAAHSWCATYVPR